MAVDPSVRIDIAAEFTGKKAFDKADKSTAKLTKSVKTLGKGFLGVFAAQKLLSYSKASVKAFAADDAAAKSLGMTLKNLGLAYGSNVGTVNGFINRLEAQTGVLDDELRPAMDRLLRATGDVAKSQELLNLALDIAAGTGKSVTQVSQSLQKAYLGQTAALGRLGVGLSKAELATGDFESIQQKLNTLFAGQAVTASNTYQGSLNKLTVASNNAKETIGKGLVDALATFSSSQSVDPVVNAIDRIAKSISNATVDFSRFLAVTKDIFTDTSFFRNQEDINRLLATKMGTRFTTPMTISSQDTQRADKLAAEAAKKLAANKIKAEKAAIKAAAAAKLAADKKAAANATILAKAQSIFNIEQIQIEAALKGKISENERLRLELQRAILNEDYVLAEKLQKQLEASQRAIGALQGQLAAVKPAANPFEAWIKSLDEIQLALQKLYATDSGKIVPFVDKDTSKMTTDELVTYVQEVADAATAAATEAVKTETYGRNFAELLAAGSSSLAGYAAVVGARYDTNLGDMSDFIPTGGQSAFSGGSSVTVNVQGSVLDGNDFVDIVNNALLNSQRQGRSQVAAGALP